MSEWLRVADTIEAAGGVVMVMPPAPHLNLTGLPYVAEAGEFYLTAEGLPAFVLPRMKSPHRQPEPSWVGGFVSALGWGVRGVKSVWEAQGDAIRVGQDRIVHTYGKGPMRRTEAGAYGEVAPLLSEHHIQIEYRAYPWFHGNTFMASFHSRCRKESVLMVCPEALEPTELLRLETFCKGSRVVEISRETSLGYATNALQVGQTVIAPAGVEERVRALWEDLGLEVVELDLFELFCRGGGAAVCLSNRLYGMSPQWVPDHLLYATQRDNLETLASSYPEEQLREGW